MSIDLVFMNFLGDQDFLMVYVFPFFLSDNICGDNIDYRYMQAVIDEIIVVSVDSHKVI